MRAQVGDWLVVHSHTEGQHDRRAEIVGTGPDGVPPYTVRWTDEDREALVFPGPDAQVVTAAEHAAHARSEAALIDRVQAGIGAHPSPAER